MAELGLLNVVNLAGMALGAAVLPHHAAGLGARCTLHQGRQP